MSRQLPERIAKRLRLPVIAAPMLRVSGPDLVIAACRSGIIGAFPTANAGDVRELDRWLERIESELSDGGRRFAPWCPNLVIRHGEEKLRRDIEVIVRRGAEMVITSVGSPAPVIEPLHEAGCLVFADVATIKHAQKAVDVGADGLILLTAGAGGQTGWLNGFAFVRAVRSFFDGPIVLAGGVSDGTALFAAQALGCDLAYMGTRMIAAEESMASQDYKNMLLGSTADDVVLTRAITGLPTSMLGPSLVAAGLDPRDLDELTTPAQARERYSQAKDPDAPRRWSGIWSAGHSVSGVARIEPLSEIVAATEREFDAARRRALSLADGAPS
ncbi:NAD(P)H-dependent flavin oxidoreductase [Burkholderia lata]|uniref:2-nitropropane dioxygenase n=1 Tax=Burkholderia lata (strain ATCC 17760 / DSM 23089 / LMG 22485 / NCIMB 9086 / R18194 / 383) TaxID=482957 RepID=A0A6P2RAT4_BURL3|nr:nitronate monooxygenase [Burkholderia lata]VWC32266.1 2-nitropropane dioxygenase [Burkholderia lata]